MDDAVPLHVLWLGLPPKKQPEDMSGVRHDRHAAAQTSELDLDFAAVIRFTRSLRVCPDNGVDQTTLCVQGCMMDASVAIPRSAGYSAAGASSMSHKNQTSMRLRRSSWKPRSHTSQAQSHQETATSVLGTLATPHMHHLTR